MKHETGAEGTPAIGISFQHALDDHRSVVFQSFVPADCSDSEFNSMLDKLTRVSDRQRAKTHLPNTRTLLRIKQEQLKETEFRLREAVNELNGLDSKWNEIHKESGRRGEFKPSAQSIAERTRLEGIRNKEVQTLQTLRNEIGQYEAQIAEMEAKIQSAESANDNGG